MPEKANILLSIMHGNGNACLTKQEETPFSLLDFYFYLTRAVSRIQSVICS